MLGELLTLRRKATLVNRPDLASTLSAFGRALLGLGNAQGAEPHLREAIAIRREVLPKGHYATANTEILLGDCLRLQGHYKEAEPLLLEGYQVMSSAPGVPKQRLRQVLGRIITLYEVEGRRDEVHRWRTELMDLDFPSDPFAP